MREFYDVPSCIVSSANIKYVHVVEVTITTHLKDFTLCIHILGFSCSQFCQMAGGGLWRRTKNPPF